MHYGLVTVNGIIHRWAPDGGRVESHYVLTETAFRMAVDLLPIDYRAHWFFKKDERR